MRLAPDTSTFSTAMKVVKIYDNNCDVCRQMSVFDSDVVLNLDSKPEYRTVELGVILDPDTEDPEDAALAHYAEIHAVNPDYTIDLPVYMVLEGKKYLGHVGQVNTQTELKEKLERIVSGAENTKGRDHLYN